jgi:pyruvate dehydrogenase E1 component alpha subunit
MPEKTLATFEVKFLQILDEKGGADESLLPALTDEQYRQFFEKIILARTFNSRARSLQREGRIGTYASIYGQEACQVGSAMALEKGDWVFPTFRESGVSLALGYPIWMMFRYWLGDERGMKTPDELNIFPMSVPVGSHITHATGAAFAMQYKGQKNAAVAYFGDGGSSRGDFHEGLNIAGVFKVPAVFICVNNQWAISVPRARQSAAKTIAQRAWSFGFEGLQVDGNDVLAVYKATKDALEKGKSGGGPTLLEFFTYRLDDHTTADDASRYRSDEEVKKWEAREPLIRLRLFMEKKGVWTEEYEKEVTKKIEDTVDKAIEEEEAFRPPEARDIFDYTSAELNQRQIRELKERGWEK